ncbi:hypothetical protein RV11_GL003171 [Enterococcus phoeniculicola]|uniref:hypothetical protein n=1 Tax=Enterococcus phoeniculicola TaxID=154621 RepID=UPI0003A994DF|nr:hypothetical protein [Enterococcus phoeniculicola]OJG72200.1 hypothetical protein RV11_GL003171 [Enterococcus phoeniculicola]
MVIRKGNKRVSATLEPIHQKKLEKMKKMNPTFRYTALVRNSINQEYSRLEKEGGKNNLF